MLCNLLVLINLSSIYLLVVIHAICIKKIFNLERKFNIKFLDLKLPDNHYIPRISLLSKIYSFPLMFRNVIINIINLASLYIPLRIHHLIYIIITTLLCLNIYVNPQNRLIEKIFPFLGVIFSIPQVIINEPDLKSKSIFLNNWLSCSVYLFVFVIQSKYTFNLYRHS